MEKQSAQEKIKSAFVQSVLEKGFEKTTVSGIIRLAGVHRSTFYAHYEDKFDLLEKLQDQVIQEMTLQFLNGRDFMEITKGDIAVERDQYQSLLVYIQSEKDVISAMQVPDSPINFMLHFQEELNDLFIETFNHHQQKIEFGDPILEEYSDDIFIESLFVLLKKWISRKCQEDVEMMVDLIYRLEHIYY